MTSTATPAVQTAHVSPNDPHPRARATIAGGTMAYVDTGTGEAVVLLHGNPTSSRLWRNVIPHLSDAYRCLAPDLMGMGDSSATPGGACRFTDHARYLDAWFDAVLPAGRVTLVLHDWGSALGFNWARRHPQRVNAIAYMEAIVQPRRWSDFPPERAALFRALRGEEGERLVREENFFVETVLPHSVLRALSAEEMDAWRKPFTSRESRMTTLVWARELPIEGEPADVAHAVQAYGAWLASSAMPKLLIRAEPGALLTGRALDFCRTWPNQRETTVAGIHYVQEDSPHEIGVAVRGFLDALA
ncbi:haloalkane dehalogenase [Paraburkholderia unamae]|uniref:haloalkane dehalogenase n=1 Tax=Paraburkholderia unamae TaxID=219649 RepID=UPI000DC3C6B4|nr:haloalkane dehalogenase [Paraburkholderia unamae]RAR48663.1 haloalkane dehalogenase [Paraburkholderia unamae]